MSDAAVEVTEIVPTQSLVTLAAPLPEIVAAQQQHAATCEALLDADDYQKIGNKSFKKKSAWRKLGVAYAVSHEILSKEYWYDENDHIRRAEFVVRATAPNGRFEDGVGLCDLSERNFGAKQDHDIPATAHTRAVNRASSDLFGLGEVSAEEVEGGAGSSFDRPTETRPPAARQLSGGSGPTEAQQRFMSRLIDEQGLSSTDILRDAEKVTARSVADVSDLTVGEASRLIDFWKTGECP